MNPLIGLTAGGIVATQLLDETQFKLLFHYNDEELFSFSSYCLFSSLYHIIMGLTPSKTKLAELNPTQALYGHYQDNDGYLDDASYHSAWRQMNRSISNAESRFHMEPDSHPLKPKSNSAVREGMSISMVQKQMLDKMEITGITSAKKLKSLGDSNNVSTDKFKEIFQSYDEAIEGNLSDSDNKLTFILNILDLYALENSIAFERIYAVASLADQTGIKQTNRTYTCDSLVIRYLFSMIDIHGYDVVKLQSLGYLPSRIRPCTRCSSFFDLVWWNRYLQHLDVDRLNSPEELDTITARIYLATAMEDTVFVPEIDICLRKYSKDDLQDIVSEFIEQCYDVRTIFHTEKVWTKRKIKFARMLCNSI